MKCIVEYLLLAVPVVGLVGGIWNRIKLKKAIGIRFIQYSGLVILFPVLAVLALEGRVSAEITGAIIAAAVGGLIGSIGKDDLPSTKSNSSTQKVDSEISGKSADGGFWRHPKKIAGGAAIFVGVLALLAAGTYGGRVWYQNRLDKSQQWNTNAIKATFKELTVSESTPKFRYTFSYVLENTTIYDYSIEDGSQALIMAKLPNGEGYETDPSLSVEPSIFIPAKEKVVLKVFKDCDYDEDYSERDRDNLDKLTAYTHKMLEQLDGFTLLDRTKRFEIALPNGWPKAKTSGSGQLK